MSEDRGAPARGEEDPRVLDDPGGRRYELRLGDTLAGFLAYRLEPGVMVLVHTEVDEAFGGRGLGGVLVRGTLEDARARGLSVVAECPYVRSYLRRHPDDGDPIGPAATTGG